MTMALSWYLQQRQLKSSVSSSLLRWGYLINISTYIYIIMVKYNHFVTCYVLVKRFLAHKCFYVYK